VGRWAISQSHVSIMAIIRCPAAASDQLQLCIDSQVFGKFAIVRIEGGGRLSVAAVISFGVLVDF